MTYRGPGTLFFVAVYGVPIASCVVVEIAYQIARLTTGPKFSMTIAYVVIVSCALVGVVLLQLRGSWTLGLRFVASIIYFPAMCIALFWVIGLYMMFRGFIPVAIH